MNKGQRTNNEKMENGFEEILSDSKPECDEGVPHEHHWDGNVSQESDTTATSDCDANATSNKRAKRPFGEDKDDPETSEMEPQKKLCRFYYLDQCTKADRCSFMHSEFPCKFYYFGFECRDGEPCKLRHGTALAEDMKEALWEHVSSAPANLLQWFPCFPHALLKKNFEERHYELTQMEQEGLFGTVPCPTDEDIERNISSTLLGEMIKTVTKTQLLADVRLQLGELAEILTPEQIVALINIGVQSLEQLFQLGASSLLELGFDYDTLIKVGNFKEAQRKRSIYTVEESKVFEDVALDDMNTVDVFSAEEASDSSALCVTLCPQPAFTDQELLSVLNDELNASNASTINQSSTCDTTVNESNTDLEHETSMEGSMIDSLNKSGSQEHLNGIDISTKTSRVSIGSLLNLGYSLSQLEVLEEQKGIELTASFSLAEAEDAKNDDCQKLDKTLSDLDASVLEALESDTSTDRSTHLQFTMFTSVKEKENDVKGMESIKRTVEQLQKIDCLVNEQREPDVEWASDESDTSNDHLKHDSSVTDTANRSLGSDSDSQTIFRMPFKSIIDRYTPATEIDAYNGKFSAALYKLTPIDIPKPNFERIRRSFVTDPTCSLDPRIQLMFNIGAPEERQVDRSVIIARDPRLNKQLQPQPSDTERTI